MKDFLKVYFLVHWRKKIRYVISLLICIFSVLHSYFLSVIINSFIYAIVTNTHNEMNASFLSTNIIASIILAFLAMIPIWKTNREFAYIYSVKKDEIKIKKYKRLANLISLLTFIIIIFVILLIISLLWGQF